MGGARAAPYARHHGQQDGGCHQGGAGKGDPGMAVSETAGALARTAGLASLAAAAEQQV